MFPGKLPLEDYIYSWYTIFLALGIGLILGFRNWMKGMPCPSNDKVENKIAIVTGANSGIGKQIAKELAARGAKVILACRDEEKGREAAKEIFTATGNKNVNCLKLDLASFESIRNFAAVINKKKHGLHILVNNAGVMCHPRDKTVEGHELHFGVNYLGHFLLTHLLLDKLKASSPARIINASAVAYQIAEPNLDDLDYSQKEYQPGDAYAQSKIFILWWTRHLARQLEGTKVTVNAYHPGVVNTDLHRHMPFKKSLVVKWSFAPVMWMLMKGAKDGAQTPVFMAVSQAEEGVSGKYYVECAMKEVEEIGKNEEQEQKLWDISMKLCGLSTESLTEAGDQNGSDTEEKALEQQESEEKSEDAKKEE